MYILLETLFLLKLIVRIIIFFPSMFFLVLDDLIAQEKTDEDKYMTEVLETTCFAARYLK